MDDPSEKLFDKAGADTLLPRLRTLIRSLQEVAASGPAFEGRERLAHAGRSNGSPDAAASVFRAAAEIQAVLEKIAGTGAILRDLATGLCDFPAVRGPAGLPLLAAGRGRGRVVAPTGHGRRRPRAAVEAPSFALMRASGHRRPALPPPPDATLPVKRLRPVASPRHITTTLCGKGRCGTPRKGGSCR